MAKVFEMDEKEHALWVKELPEGARKVAEVYRHDTLYRMKDTGQRVVIAAYANNGTVTVAVLGKFNLVDFETEVFGIDPSNLEECDLPGPEETVGVLLKSEEAIKKQIQIRRKRMGFK
jgi:hypothetical protein